MILCGTLGKRVSRLCSKILRHRLLFFVRTVGRDISILGCRGYYEGGGEWAYEES